MSNKKILLVDDDAEDRFIVYDALENAGDGPGLSFAENGAQAITALDAIANQGDLPCLIILDLNMPKLNGADTLQYLKATASYAHIPVIIYSTSENPAEKEKCLALGAYAFITKPSSVNEWKQTAALFLSFCKDQPV